MCEVTSSSPPLVSVIVPHYNDVGNLQRCLESLRSQTFPGAAFEVVVADNQSTVSLAPVLQAFSEFMHLVVEPRKGAGAARNAGRLAARGEILAFIDSDCLADANWLEYGVRAIAGADLIGGQVQCYTQSAKRTGADIFELIFAFNQKDYVERKGFSVTANLFVRAATFDRVGPFLVGPSEDVEWCRRARALGFVLAYDAAPLVRHPTRPDWPSLRQKWKRTTIEAYHLHLLEKRHKAAWLARAVIIVLSAIPHTVRVVTASELTLGERVQGVAMLWRLRIWRGLACWRVALRGAESLG